MKEDITIEICTGTTCFVMGSSNLQLIEDHLPNELKPRVKVMGTMCMDLCEAESCENAPFVKINGEVLSKASIPSILARLKKLQVEGQLS